MTIDPVAEELLARAPTSPVEVLEASERFLELDPDPDSAAIASRAMSIAARTASTMEISIEYGRRAASVAVDPVIRSQSLMTLAGSQAMHGDHIGALRSLDDAGEDATGLLAAQIRFQRGVVHNIAGAWDDALEAYEEAMPKFQEAERADFVAQVLHNQGHIYTQMGRLDQAEEVLLNARRIEEEQGSLLEVAGTDHNLGLLASYRGDIPEALRRLTSSDEIHMEITGDDLPRHVGRCDVLISVGLFHEAYDLSRSIAAGAKRRGRADDEADALLVAARAGLLAGDQSGAISLAAKAKRAFAQQERRSWELQADLVSIESRHGRDGASVELQGQAIRLQENLIDAALPVVAARARLLAGQIAIENGDLETASELLEVTMAPASVPAEVRVQNKAGLARLRLARGDARGADAAARSGLSLLENYQASLGASDLRSGIERQGLDLADVGLRLAVTAGRPGRVFRWLERTRARALLYPPVVPDRDDPGSEILAELRRVGAEMRDPGRVNDPDLVRRQHQLQEQLKRATRVHRSSSSANRGLSIDRLVESLGDSTLIEIGVAAGRLIAVTIRSGRFEFHELGDAHQVELELARLRSQMRRTALLDRNPKQAQAGVEAFGRSVLGAIRPGDGPVVVVPPGSLMAAPWAALPGFGDSTVTVSPSAEVWLRASENAPNGSGVVLAAGPDLVHAESEIRELKRIYPDAVVIPPEGQSVALAEQADGAAVVHAACHAGFKIENPMFSSLRLGDGDFNVYDLERLDQPPELMVLSACDSGFSDTRSGDELTGLTSALLSTGSRTVVASVGLVPDSVATSELMVRFHRGIREELSPSEALSNAQKALIDDSRGYVAAASFLCIGAG